MTSSLARPSTPLPPNARAGILLADVISYGYAVVVALTTLALDLQFELWQGVLIACLFVALRGVARELRRDARRAVLSEARRHAAARARSPRSWSVEQRDGLGRRVDSGA